MHRQYILALIVLLTLAGCAAHEYRDLHYQAGITPPYKFSVGDTVNILTNDAREHEFEVIEVSDTGITGENIEIAYSDIRIARVKQIDKGETAANWFDSMTVTILVLMSVALIALGG
jgi:hypothetical protein